MDAPPAALAPQPPVAAIVAASPTRIPVRAMARPASGSGVLVLAIRPGGNPLALIPRHNPLIAMGLSLAVNGLGQFYNGDASKGWWMLGSWLVYPAAWGLDSLLQTGYFRAGALVLELGVKGYSAYDAYQSAAAYRRAHPGGSR